MLKKCYIIILLAIVFGVINTVFAADSEFVLDGDTSNSSFSVKKANKDTIAHFSGDGNVGLGTPDPTAHLHIDTAINNRGLRLFDDGISSWVYEIVPGQYRNVLEQNSPSVAFVWGERNKADDAGSAITEWMRVNKDGNVGIGTNEPKTTLDVRGKVIFTNGGSSLITGTTFERRLTIVDKVDSAALQIVNNGEGGREFGILVGDNNSTGLVKNSFAIWDQTVNSGRFFINPGGDILLTPSASGNVGIGVTSPTEKLDVNGNINASGTISQGSSRDFKDNITTISTEEALDTIKKLYPVAFNYKNDSFNEKHLGFIAEDVPEIVASKDRKHLSSMDFTAILTKVVQEQQRMLKEHQDTIEEMAGRIKALEFTKNKGNNAL